MRIERIKVSIGCESCVGVGRQRRPVSHGNYFWFYRKGHDTDLRCINMWSENLISARRKFLKDGFVEVAIFEEEGKLGNNAWAIVVDCRIPKNWFTKRLCFTGHKWPSTETARQMYELVGDPNGELEEWTNPESYYTKRGAKYDPKSGTVVWTIKAAARPLKVKWTVEAMEPVEPMHGLDLETELAGLLSQNILNAIP